MTFTGRWCGSAPFPPSARCSSLLGMQFANLRAWQVLLAGLGSPLRTTVVGRIYFIGQLGKYLPGSVWPILAQMELGAAHRVPRARSATTAVLAMMIGLLTGLITALVTLPFTAHSAAVRVGLPGRAGADRLPPPEAAQPAPAARVQAGQAARPWKSR